MYLDIAKKINGKRRQRNLGQFLRVQRPPLSFLSVRRETPTEDNSTFVLGTTARGSSTLPPPSTLRGGTSTTAVPTPGLLPAFVDEPAGIGKSGQAAAALSMRLSPPRSSCWPPPY
ncbi:hypothetical protein U9M48_038228 [Paspalum notatum var. saurae]|uniref:Uncharacterized protein n=1 Tax=Paspalum notatum var. saurae TaxID=547442 RepID=A0AAQ3XBV9_PASNO